MSKYTKDVVIEQLNQRGIEFNEAHFRSCVNKARRNCRGGNRFLFALNVFDLYVHNLALLKL